MTDSTRRSFLSGLATAAAASPLLASMPNSNPAPAAAVRASDPQTLLVLGGTGFLGPHFVQSALARGHKVTLFHRGKTNAELFPNLEHIKGDRETGDLEALKDRTFDAIVDNSGYVPAHVEATAKLFAATAKQYLFVSTVSVYDEPENGPNTFDESSAVGTVTDEQVAAVRTIRESMPHYGALKARCEAAAEAQMPGKVSNVRPGLIVGPRDTSDRFTWWPVRADRGGEILAPGDRDAEVQMIDVRDLAEWMVHVLEQRIFGVFNAVGYGGSTTMDQVLQSCRSATSTPSSLTWVDEEFLLEQKVGPWMEMPLWIPRDARRRYHNERAIGNGLAFRPLADTIRDTLTWAKTERGDRPFARTGLPAEREAAVLAAFAKKGK